MRCHYSGAPINAETTEEHIIPKKLGGRIKSKSIMHSTVNIDFSKIDNALIARYRPVLLQLFDLIPSVARPENIAIEMNGIEGGQFLLTHEGPMLKQSKGSRVKIDGEDVFLFNPDSETPDFYSRNSKEIKSVQYSERKDLNGDTYGFWNTLVSPQIDLAILKIACSSAIHICNTFPEIRIRESCIILAKAIYQSLNDHDACSECIHKHMLGFQFDSKKLIRTLENCCGKAQQFTHYIAIYSNLTSRTIDAAVALFGCEVFGVRLCNNAPFMPGFVIVNPILQNTASFIHPFEPNEDFVVKSTAGKSHIFTSTPPIEFEIVKKAVQESMDDLLAMAQFHAECESVNKFRSAINQWIKHFLALSNDTQEPYPTLGDICRKRISLYFLDACNPIVPEHFECFKRFDYPINSFKEIDEDIFSELFHAHKSTIIKLSSSYGIPRIQQSRDFDIDFKLSP